ncbi:hypothetical protein [Alkaliphilus oremlandii]|uniref:Quinate 5-dehydrogenase n=1 Tax=Alkaliphilus oremlandii (strain OhILAs) TaxID=350688 RepID=A8MLU3_ALKOO|nr:hypothetical protein [Alkaliphilus oremlandii]ABW18010.1 conserved hypothetical protein [Alkaliphilus oremlandii OhILAs]
MKKIVSISIGSSKRDHHVTANIMGEDFSIERIGTDGSMERAMDLVRSLDGKVDAIGMGGIDLYLQAGKKSYEIREAARLKNMAQITPVVDGSGLKNTLEKQVIHYLKNKDIVDFKNKRTLITCGMDRFGMAEALVNCGAHILLGDLMFALNINIPIGSLKNLQRVAAILAPIACRLPFHLLYPTGEEQNKNVSNKYGTYFDDSEIIAGDFHYIKRFMPEEMGGKILITNTVTEEDIEMLEKRGVAMLVTTTPEFQGRSFGTNVMEAVVVSLLRDRGRACTSNEYYKIIEELSLKPRIEYLNNMKGLL